MFGRLSLRSRLILAVITLAALGFLAADVATYSSLRSFLIHRTDTSLEAAHRAVEQALPNSSDQFGLNDTTRVLLAAVPGDYLQLRRLNGSVVPGGGFVTRQPTQQPPPRLPASIALPGSSTGGGDRVSYLTVPAQKGGDRYRVRASIEPLLPGYVLIIATSLSGVDSTLHHLLLIELLVTLLVLAAIAALGLWLVRVSLRPLDEIGTTAAAIAAGDLSRRVERAEERTEVGRLGVALNTMLGQIEAAFRGREESERKLRRFVADASHELRTPLAAVRAYAELFTRGAAERPADLARSMTGIRREAERMSRLVEDLLLLARLDEGRPLEQEPVELEAVVAEAVETAQAVEPGRPIELELASAVVIGDRDRLRQSVDNLLANVRAHTPAIAPARVTLRRTDDGAAEITVTDAGPGLDADQVVHIFERFYRTDASRARASGGVGLGLAIVAAVVDAHGGRASAHSAPEGGASFRIELPLASARQSVETARGQPLANLGLSATRSQPGSS